jgi:DNA-binding protein HU-beta
MNKQDLIDFVATQCEFTKADATRAVEAFCSGVTTTLKNDGKVTLVTLVGFGTFQVGERAATTGRNPRTGEPISIPASKTPKFKAGKELKEAVNS